jgi:pimeloyl-ACP methyl ester carboxylesterase
MKSRNAVRAVLCVLLCVTGFILARAAAPYRVTSVVIDAGGCRLVTDIVDSGKEEVQGSVVLLHGVAANKKIMSYLAYGFAQQNLRVFVPDLPGHGRTQGPFSFARAETCSDSLVRQLIARGAIDAGRTILAGHSMGGAIAVRVAARVPVAGVIAISPAPMSSAHGIPPDGVLFRSVPMTPANTLVISGSWEPSAVRDTARDLVTGGGTPNGKYVLVPHATHVSLLFDRRVAGALQEWAAETLHLSPNPGLPYSGALSGCLLGLAGLLLLSGPFLRETLNLRPHLKDAAQAGPFGNEPILNAAVAPSGVRLLLEIGLVSLVSVVGLRFWNPLSFVRVFNGGYLVSFLLLTGLGLLLLHCITARPLWSRDARTLLAAVFAGLVLHLLIMGWFEVTLTETWLSGARWARFPFLFLGVLPYLAAEELLLGPSFVRGRLAHFFLALASRVVVLVALIMGILALHSGAILLLLLAPYLFAFFILQRLGMDVVRKDTGSPMAAALFGAILLAGFCLVIFPVT